MDILHFSLMSIEENIMASESTGLGTSTWYQEPIITRWLHAIQEGDEKSNREAPIIALGEDKSVCVVRGVAELAVMGSKYHRVSLKEFTRLANESGAIKDWKNLFLLVQVCARYYKEERAQRNSETTQEVDQIALERDFKEFDSTIEALAFKSIDLKIYLTTEAQYFSSSDKAVFRNMVAWRNEQGNNLLHRAIQSGKISHIKKMLKLDNIVRKKEDTSLVLSPNSNGDTPLHLAAEVDDGGCLNLLLLVEYMEERLLANGVKWKTAQNKQGLTPLHIAVGKDRIDRITRIYQLKAEIQLNGRIVTQELQCIADSNGNTAGHLAVEKGLFDMLPFLNVPIRNKEGLTPFTLAISKGDTRIVSFLLELYAMEGQVCQVLFFNDDKVKPLELAQIADSKFPDSKMVETLQKYVKPEQDFVFLCKQTQSKVKEWGKLIGQPFTSHDDFRKIGRLINPNMPKLLEMTKDPWRSLLKHVYGCFYRSLESVQGSISSLFNKSNDKNESKETLKAKEEFLTGFIEDCSTRNFQEVLSGLEASINSLQSAITQNEAMHATYYKPFINIAEIALRKLAALATRSKFNGDEGQVIMDLYVELDAFIKKAEELDDHLPLKTLSYKDLDDKQKEQMNAKLRDLGLTLITNGDCESLMKAWGPVKNILKSKIESKPKAQPSLQEGQALTIDEASDGIVLQNLFNKWLELGDNQQISNALQLSVQKGLKGTFGDAIKEALEFGFLEQSKILGLILLDHIQSQHSDATTLLDLFKQRKSAASSSLSEQEEKQIHEKEELQGKALITLKHITQRLLKAEDPDRWTIKQIAQLLIMPTERQTNNSTPAEKEALLAFNTIISQMRIDKTTFNAINKFLLWPLYSPKEYNNYITYLDAYRVLQMEGFGNR